MFTFLYCSLLVFLWNELNILYFFQYRKVLKNGNLSVANFKINEKIMFTEIFDIYLPYPMGGQLRSKWRKTVS